MLKIVSQQPVLVSLWYLFFPLLTIILNGIKQENLAYGSSCSWTIYGYKLCEL